MKLKKSTFVGIAIIALSWTNVSVAEFDGFRLMIFWPVFVLLLLMYVPSRDTFRLSPLAAPWLAGVALMAISVVANLANVRFGTIVLSVGWLSYSLWLLGNVGRFPRALMEKTIRVVVYCFAVSVGLGVLFVTAGMTTPYFPMLIGWVVDFLTGAIRYQGMSTEPSYAALILAISGLALLRLRKTTSSPARITKEEFLFLGMIALVMVFLLSVYGLVAFAILCGAYISCFGTKFIRFAIVLLGVIAAIILYYTVLIDSRVAKVLPLLISFRFIDLSMVDNSSFMRVGPTIQMLTDVSVTSPEFWIGHGAGQAELYFGQHYGYMLGDDVDTMNMGFIPAFMYDWGILTATAFFSFAMLICKGPLSSYARLMVVLSLFNCNFNTQLFWFIMTAMIISSPGWAVASGKLSRARTVFSNAPGAFRHESC